MNPATSPMLPDGTPSGLEPMQNDDQTSEQGPILRLPYKNPTLQKVWEQILFETSTRFSNEPRHKRYAMIFDAAQNKLVDTIIIWHKDIPYMRFDEAWSETHIIVRQALDKVLDLDLNAEGFMASLDQIGDERLVQALRQSLAQDKGEEFSAEQLPEQISTTTVSKPSALHDLDSQQNYPAMPPTQPRPPIDRDPITYAACIYEKKRAAKIWHSLTSERWADPSGALGGIGFVNGVLAVKSNIGYWAESLQQLAEAMEKRER
ncbi:MAG: hypothetical protein Q9218_003434 [Villophora microphyllina]